MSLLVVGVVHLVFLRAPGEARAGVNMSAQMSRESAGHFQCRRPRPGCVGCI